MKAQLGNRSKVVEALLPFQDAHVLVEAKMGLFPDNIMTVSDPILNTSQTLDVVEK